MSDHFGDTFVLDTGNMETVAQSLDDLAKQMLETRQKLDDACTLAINNWSGKGSRSFQKKYHLLTQQLNDISDELYEVASAVRDANDSYIQSDMEMAKQIEGQSSLI